MALCDGQKEGATRDSQECTTYTDKGNLHQVVTAEKVTQRVHGISYSRREEVDLLSAR